VKTPMSFAPLALFLAMFATRAEANTKVLWDEAHGQQFLIERQDPLDLSKLADVFAAAGLEVTSGREPISDATLAGVDGLVLSGAFVPPTDEEVAAVKRFLERGGSLAVMLHIAPPVRALLTALGVSYSNGVIREDGAAIEGDPLNVRITHISDHPLMSGVAEFDVYGAWALLNRGNDVGVLARTGDEAWVDLDGNRTRDGHDAVQSFAVVVGGDAGKGSFVVFGDDALFQNRFLSAGNETLARNLARWFTAGASKSTARVPASDGAAQ